MKKICIATFVCLILCFYPMNVKSDNSEFQQIDNTNFDNPIEENSQNTFIEKAKDSINNSKSMFSFEITKEQLEKYHQNHLIKSWEKKAENFFTQLKFIIYSIFKAPEEIQNAFFKLFSEQKLSFWYLLRLLFSFLAILLVSFCIEYFFRKKLSKTRKQIKEKIASGIISMLLRIFLYTLINILFLHIFSLSCIIQYILFFRNCGYVSYLIIQIIFTIFIVRVISIISEFILSPHAPALRLLPISGKDSIYIYRWSIAIAIVSVACANNIILLRVLGISNSLFLLLYSFTGFIPINMIVYMIWDKRETVANAILNTKGEFDNSIQNHFARFWHIYATIYSYFMWIFWEINLIMTGHDLVFSFIASFVIIPLFFAVDAVIWRLLCIAFGHKHIPSTTIFNILPDSTKHLEDSLNPRAVNYIRSILRIIRIGLLGLLYLWVKNLWGFGHSLEKEFAKATFIITFTILIASSVWEFLIIFIDEKLIKNQITENKNNDNSSYSYNSRTQTLITILKKFILIILLIIVSLIILFSIGINILPFLAGAGLIGLGIGFGTQTFIKDFFSGIFFLIDDAFRIGDYVDTGNEKGTVENISLRSLRLRHHRGMVYTIPFGELRSITNYSRDWIIMNVDIQVPFKTEIDKIELIINKINLKLLSDPVIKDKLIDSLNFMGIRRIENFGIIIRSCFKSKPGEQFIIRKQIYKFIYDFFNQEGIYLGKTLYLPWNSNEYTS